jgi:hypothetical protein
MPRALGASIYASSGARPITALPHHAMKKGDMGDTLNS